MIKKLILNEETYFIDGMRKAFDKKTGEIDWNCVCLSKYVNGSCKEEFKKAFECFYKDQKNCKKFYYNFMKCFSSKN